MLRTTEPEANVAYYPVPAGVAVSYGDLMYIDTTNNVARPASAMADAGTEAQNQVAFRLVFLGVAVGELKGNEGGTQMLPVLRYGAVTMDCESATFLVDDWVGVKENAGGTAILNSTVKKVTNQANAIGRVERPATNSTLVTFRLRTSRAGIANLA